MKLKFLSLFLLGLIVSSDNIIAKEIYANNSSRLELFTELNDSFLIFYKDLYYKNSNHITLKNNLVEEYTINNKVIGFGKLDYQIDLNLSKNRTNLNHLINLSLVGLKYENVGVFSYGKDINIFYDVESWTSLLSHTHNMSIISNYIINSNYHMVTYRSFNILKKSKGIGRLHIAFQYQNNNKIFKINEKKTCNYEINNFNNYGISIIYNISNEINLGLIFLNKDNYINNSLEEKNAIYSFGVKYKKNNFYMSTIYNKILNLKKNNLFYMKSYNTNSNVSVIELVTKYRFNSNLSPFFNYFYEKVIRDNSDNFPQYTSYMDLGTIYNFNKNILTYIKYKVNNLIKTENLNKNIYDKRSENIIFLGIIYKFNLL